MNALELLNDRELLSREFGNKIAGGGIPIIESVDQGESLPDLKDLEIDVTSDQEIFEEDSKLEE